MVFFAVDATSQTLNLPEGAFAATGEEEFKVIGIVECVRCRGEERLSESAVHRLVCNQKVRRRSKADLCFIRCIVGTESVADEESLEDLHLQFCWQSSEGEHWSDHLANEWGKCEQEEVDVKVQSEDETWVDFEGISLGWRGEDRGKVTNLLASQQGSEG